MVKRIGIERIALGLSAVVALGNTACSSAENPAPAPTATVTATETVTATPSPEVSPTPEGRIDLDPAQEVRISEILRNNAINGFMETRGIDGDDEYNGYGQLMTRRESDYGEELAYVRFENTPSEVVLSTEEVFFNPEGEVLHSNWMQFSNSSPGAIEATSDGILTTKEAQELFGDPATEFRFGHQSFSDGSVIQVVVDGGVLVEVGSVEDKSYGEYDNKLQGLTSVSDIAAAEEKLTVFLNAR